MAAFAIVPIATPEARQHSPEARPPARAPKDLAHTQRERDRNSATYTMSRCVAPLVLLSDHCT